jgi:hypothetical protein
MAAATDVTRTVRKGTGEMPEVANGEANSQVMDTIMRLTFQVTAIATIPRVRPPTGNLSIALPRSQPKVTAAKPHP